MRIFSKASARGTIEIDADLLVTNGIFESTRGDAPDLEGTLYDIGHYMSKVPLDRITKFETAQRQLEAFQLMASAERASLADRLGGCDPLALIDDFTPVEDNIGLLEIRFEEEEVIFVFVCPEDVTGAEVLMIDKVIHIVKTDIVKLVVEIESSGMSSDEFDKENGSADGLQPNQADSSCIHALNKLHVHEIHVVLNRHDADGY
nr:hypothetical protein [Tanacetum cinerariifolium]